MTKITFIEPSDNEHVVEAESGLSLKEVAVRNGVAGIIAECGGNCACGTCRVYIDRPVPSSMAAPEQMEQDMIDFIEDANPSLRLSCQIEVTDALDGLIVRVSPNQH